MVDAPRQIPSEIDMINGVPSWVDLLDHFAIFPIIIQLTVIDVSEYGKYKILFVTGFVSESFCLFGIKVDDTLISGNWQNPCFSIVMFNT